MKKNFGTVTAKLKAFVSYGKEWIRQYPSRYCLAIIGKAKADPKERNRVLILSFSILFILDYCMICYHIEKNIFNFFPSFPLIAEKAKATVYLPPLEGDTLLEEKRDIPEYESDEQRIRYLFLSVVKGSIYENTSFAVPINIRVRRVWRYGNGDAKGQGARHCVIDINADLLQEKASIIKGSEAIFRKAIEKTITANLPSIQSVTIVEKGIPEKELWEL